MYFLSLTLLNLIQECYVEHFFVKFSSKELSLLYREGTKMFLHRIGKSSFQHSTSKGTLYLIIKSVFRVANSALDVKCTVK
jgi:hypothetical protein